MMNLYIRISFSLERVVCISTNVDVTIEIHSYLWLNVGQSL